MGTIELADTLAALVDGLPGPEQAGVVVATVEIDLPLEVRAVVEGGRFVFFAAPPHTRFRAGLLPPVQRSRLVVEAVPGGPVAEAGS